jgi:hypothetical protein
VCLGRIIRELAHEDHPRLGPAQCGQGRGFACGHHRGYVQDRVPVLIEGRDIQLALDDHLRSVKREQASGCLDECRIHAQEINAAIGRIQVEARRKAFALSRIAPGDAEQPRQRRALAAGAAELRKKSYLQTADQHGDHPSFKPILISNSRAQLTSTQTA